MGRILSAYFFCFLQSERCERERKAAKKVDVRCATYTENVQLRFVQTHVTEGKPGEESGQQDEHWNEHSEDDEIRVMLFSSLYVGVDMVGEILARVTKELAEVVGGEGEDGVSQTRIAVACMA